MDATTFLTASLSPSIYGKQSFYHTIKIESMKGYSLSLLSRQIFQCFAKVWYV